MQLPTKHQGRWHRIEQRAVDPPAVSPKSHNKATIIVLTQLEKWMIVIYHTLQVVNSSFLYFSVSEKMREWSMGV